MELIGKFESNQVFQKRSLKAGDAAGRTMRERAVIIASGLMAGGALGGVLGALLRLFPGYREDLVKTPFYDTPSASELVSAGTFVALCLYLWFAAMQKPKPEKTA